MFIGWRHVVADDLEVQDCILYRDRDVVLRLVLDRALKFRAFHERQVDEAYDDLLVGHTDGDVLAVQPVASPQLLDRRGNRFRVDDLAFDHGTHRYRDQAIRSECVPGAYGFELRGSHMIGPDIETDGHRLGTEGEKTHGSPPSAVTAAT